jgi:hypothetical protein
MSQPEPVARGRRLIRHPSQFIRCISGGAKSPITAGSQKNPIIDRRLEVRGAQMSKPIIRSSIRQAKGIASI